MSRLARAFGLFTVALGLLVISINPAYAAAAHSVATLKIVSVPGYPVALTGSGWHASRRIIFTVKELSLTEGVQIVTNRKGSFTVGLEGVNMCAQPLFTAGIPGGYRARIHVTWFQCAIPPSVPDPQITILDGTPAPMTTYKITGLEPRSVKMRVGDELYIWESGADKPSWTPHVDSAYLQLVRQGTTPPRMCPEVDCAQGFYWDYVAIHTGETGVGMTAACRDSSPPCMVPDLLINVEILPAKLSHHL